MAGVLAALGRRLCFDCLCYVTIFLDVPEAYSLFGADCAQHEEKYWRMRKAANMRYTPNKTHLMLADSARLTAYYLRCGAVDWSDQAYFDRWISRILVRHLVQARAFRAARKHIEQHKPTIEHAHANTCKHLMRCISANDLEMFRFVFRRFSLHKPVTKAVFDQAVAGGNSGIVEVILDAPTTALSLWFVVWASVLDAVRADLTVPVIRRLIVICMGKTSETVSLQYLRALETAARNRRRFTICAMVCTIASKLVDMMNESEGGESPLLVAVFS